MPAVPALPVAVSLVTELKVVFSAVPPNWTCAPFTKPLPFKVNVKSPVEKDCGVTLLRTGVGFQSVRVAVAVALESAALMALIAAVPGFGIWLGAVYTPLALIVPTVAFPPAMPPTNQFTF